MAASSAAWLSFASGSPVLVGAPQDGDLVIDEVSPAGADGTIEMIFSLADVEIGRQTFGERLKTIFGVVGAKTIDEGAFSDANLTFSLIPMDDGRVKAVVAPKKDENGKVPSAFFMKVKVEVRDYGFAAVNTDVKVKSATLATADAKLDLEGNTLTADTFRSPDADGKLKKLKPGTYTLDQLKTLGIERVCDSVGGGRLVIRGTGMVLLVR